MDVTKTAQSEHEAELQTKQRTPRLVGEHPPETFHLMRRMGCLLQGVERVLKEKNLEEQYEVTALFWEPFELTITGKNTGHSTIVGGLDDKENLIDGTKMIEPLGMTSSDLMAYGIRSR